jgi:AraC family cel operon transcriptional repressor
VTRNKTRPASSRDWPTEANKAGYELAGFAKRIGITGEELESLVREHFKVRAKDYLRALQINFSVDRLDAGDSIQTAATKSRFNTQQHFSREFKKHVGVTPSGYLKRKKGRAN